MRRRRRSVLHLPRCGHRGRGRGPGGEAQGPAKEVQVRTALQVRMQDGRDCTCKRRRPPQAPQRRVVPDPLEVRLRTRRCSAREPSPKGEWAPIRMGGDRAAEALRLARSGGPAAAQPCAAGALFGQMRHCS